MRHLLVLALICAMAFAFSSAAHSYGQTPRPGSSAQETDDEYKVATYKRFVENREPNPDVAYQAAKDYMGRYSKENDEYTRYLKQWIAAYEEDERARKAAAEREDREPRLLGAITQKKFADAYALAKQVLNEDSNNVKVLIPLGYSGVIASTEARNETFNAEAANYAQK